MLLNDYYGRVGEVLAGGRPEALSLENVHNRIVNEWVDELLEDVGNGRCFLPQHFRTMPSFLHQDQVESVESSILRFSRPTCLKEAFKAFDVIIGLFARFSARDAGMLRVIRATLLRAAYQESGNALVAPPPGQCGEPGGGGGSGSGGSGFAPHNDDAFGGSKLASTPGDRDGWGANASARTPGGGPSVTVMWGRSERTVVPETVDYATLRPWYERVHEIRRDLKHVTIQLDRWQNLARHPLQLIHLALDGNNDNRTSGDAEEMEVTFAHPGLSTPDLQEALTRILGMLQKDPAWNYLGGGEGGGGPDSEQIARCAFVLQSMGSPLLCRVIGDFLENPLPDEDASNLANSLGPETCGVLLRQVLSGAAGNGEDGEGGAGGGSSAAIALATGVFQQLATSNPAVLLELIGSLAGSMEKLDLLAFITDRLAQMTQEELMAALIKARGPEEAAAVLFRIIESNPEVLTSSAAVSGVLGGLRMGLQGLLAKGATEEEKMKLMQQLVSGYSKAEMAMALGQVIARLPAKDTQSLCQAMLQNMKPGAAISVMKGIDGLNVIAMPCSSSSSSSSSAAAGRGGSSSRPLSADAQMLVNALNSLSEAELLEVLKHLEGKALDHATAHFIDRLANGGEGTGGGGSGGGGVGEAIVKSLISLVQSLSPEDRATLIKQLMAAAVGGPGGGGGGGVVQGGEGSMMIIDGILDLAQALGPEDRAALILKLMEAAGSNGSGGGGGGSGSGGGRGDAIVKSLLSLAQSLAPEDRAALIKQLMAAAISGAGGDGGDGASGSKAIVDGLLNIAHALTPEDRAALIKQLMAVGGNDTALGASSGVGGGDDGLCWKCNQKKRRSSCNQSGKKAAAVKVISVGDQGVTSIINSSGSKKMWKKAAAMRLESFCQQIARVYESKIRSHDRDDVRGIERQVFPEFLRDFLIQQFGLKKMAIQTLINMQLTTWKFWKSSSRIQVFAVLAGVKTCCEERECSHPMTRPRDNVLTNAFIDFIGAIIPMHKAIDEKMGTGRKPVPLRWDAAKKAIPYV